jgi:3-methyladenine DNA glycosylase AlkD
VRVDVRAVAADIEQRLAAVGRPERAEHEKAYLRSDLRFVGASVPAIRSVARAVSRELTLDRGGLLALVAELWSRGVHECRVAAVELLAVATGTLCADDMALLEGMLRESKTWALVDALATAVVAPLVQREPAAAEELDRWAADADFWVQRAAMLALLPALRRGGGDFERFARYADATVDSKEFFLRKAIGWVLRDAGRTRPGEVEAWLAPRTGRASGVTVREAVKHLPAPSRERLLAAYRRREPAA